MLGKNLKIYGTQITAKYICESKKMKVVIFHHACTQAKNSIPGYYHPLDREKLVIPCFF